MGLDVTARDGHAEPGALTFGLVATARQERQKLGQILQLWAAALERIARNEVANRPGRIEPRVLKRRRHGDNTIGPKQRSSRIT